MKVVIMGMTEVAERLGWSKQHVSGLFCFAEFSVTTLILTIMLVKVAERAIITT